MNKFWISLISILFFINAEPIHWDISKGKPKKETSNATTEEVSNYQGNIEFQKVVSTEKDRKSLSLTIYNSGVALVREVRTLEFPNKYLELRYEGVPSQILAYTVRAKNSKDPNFKVLEQNYEFDLISRQRLLEKYVGKEVTIYDKHPTTGIETPTKARILSLDGEPIFQMENEIALNYPGRISIPTLPENLYANPTLVWKLISGKSGGQSLEVFYQTNGMGWSADYVLVLNEAENNMDMNCWVTLSNTSGASYQSANLQLLAGDVHRVPAEEVLADVMKKSKLAESEDADENQGFSQENISEYYLYTLDRPVDIAENQMKQIQMFSANSIQVEKLYTIPNLNLDNPKETSNALVSFRFDNDKKSNLGRPLPAGVLRIFKSDSKGRQQLLGEDSIKHTPTNEKVNVNIGKSFDVVASGKKTDYQKLKKTKGYRESVEVSLRNRKKESVKVRYYANISGDWKFQKTSHKFIKEAANQAYTEIILKPDSEEKVTYTYEVNEGPLEKTE